MTAEKRAMTVTRRSVIAAVGVASVSGYARPNGQVRAQPTMVEEPIRIEEPGEYRLSDDMHAEGTGFVVDTHGDVTIDGDGHTIQGSGADPAVRFGIGHLTLTDITITEFGLVTSMGGGTGGLDSLTMDRVVVHDCVEGVTSLMSGDIAIQHCAFEDIDDTVCRVQDLYDADLRIEDSVIRDAGTALWQDQVWGTELRNTTIENAGRLLMGEGRIENCLIERSSGIELNVDIAGGPVDTPIPLVRNEIVGNDIGVKVHHGHADIRENTIVDNDVGIELRPEVIDTLGTASVQHNAFSGNGSFVFRGTEGTIDATCNWWGHRTGPIHGENPVPDPEGELIDGHVEFMPWVVAQSALRETCDGGWTYESAGHGVYSDLPNELVVELVEPGEVVEYEISFDGAIEAGEFDSNASIDDTTATGSVGPNRELDNIYFDGDIVAISGSHLDRVRIFVADAQERERRYGVDPGELDDDAGDDTDGSANEETPAEHDQSNADDDGATGATDPAFPGESVGNDDESAGGRINEDWILGGAIASLLLGLGGIAGYLLKQHEDDVWR